MLHGYGNINSRRREDSKITLGSHYRIFITSLKNSPRSNGAERPVRRYYTNSDGRGKDEGIKLTLTFEEFELELL